ncbi:MAG: integral rane protein [Actinomycetia bacterium]|nr:integral rane protein [Actinomycetes bacterium]
MATLVRPEAAAPERVEAPRRWFEPLYLLVAGLVLALVVVEAVAARWGSGDFWEHAAAVRALAAHPLRPHHPLLDSGSPSAFFTPYHLVVGLFSRATGIGAMGSLAIFGVVNAAFVLATLPGFVRLFTTRRHAPTIVLVFTLLLWGPHPILWSGMLHLDVIASNAPFPSAFAIGLTLAGLVAWDRWLRTNDRGLLALVVVDSALLALVHPTTEALFLLGVAALLLAAPLDVVRARWWAVLPIGATAAVAAVAWPYFSMLEVVTTWGERFYATDRRTMTRSAGWIHRGGRVGMQPSRLSW